MVCAVMVAMVDSLGLRGSSFWVHLLTHTSLAPSAGGLDCGYPVVVLQ